MGYDSEDQEERFFEITSKRPPVPQDGGFQDSAAVRGKGDEYLVDWQSCRYCDTSAIKLLSFCLDA